MQLYDIQTIKRILARHGFRFSKALGQNFLVDADVCPAMAAALGADAQTGVLEIGPGIGVLTRELSAVAGKVVSVELDKRLLPVLAETLADCPNVQIVQGDILQLDLPQLLATHFAGCTSVKVCANLPYYITSPVIMTLLESRLPIDELVVMVQKEAGERLCAAVGSRAAGAVTVAVQYYAESAQLFDVPRTAFLPSPKVDSVVIRLRLRKEKAYCPQDEVRFFALVKAAFARRRKTALNSISGSLGMDKAALAQHFDACGIAQTARAENLTMAQLVALADSLAAAALL